MHGTASHWIEMVDDVELRKMRSPEATDGAGGENMMTGGQGSFQ